MTKQEMAKANVKATKLFASKTAKMIAEYERLVKNGTEDGYQERFGRRLAIEQLRKVKADSLYVKGHADKKNDLLIMLYNQYHEMTVEWFGSEEIRVAEWYSRGWPIFLQHHFYNNREDDKGCLAVAHWSLDEVCEFLAIQHAHRQVELLHDKRVTELWNLATASPTEVQTTTTSLPNSTSTHDRNTQEVPTPLDNVEVGIDDRLLAVMLFQIMLHVGYTSSEINDSRLGRLLAYLRNDTSQKCQESCRKAVNHARKLYDLANTGNGHKQSNQLKKLRLWLQHFTTAGASSEFGFVAYLESEINEIEDQMD